MQSKVSGFSTSDHIWVVKGVRHDGKKYRYTTNKMKLQGIISNQGTIKKLLFLFAKHTSDWLVVWGNTVTGTVLAATEFAVVYVLVTRLNLLPYTNNLMVECKPFWLFTC